MTLRRQAMDDLLPRDPRREGSDEIYPSSLARHPTPNARGEGFLRAPSPAEKLGTDPGSARRLHPSADMILTIFPVR